MLSGVSAGLADYFDIDPVWVRLTWIVTGIFSGGLIAVAYIALWIVMPEEGYVGPSSQSMRRNVDEMTSEARRMATGVRQAVSREPTGTTERETTTSGESETVSESETTTDDQPTERAIIDYQPIPYEEDRGHRRNWAAIILICLGLTFLASNFGMFWWFNWKLFWPLVLIGVGTWLLVNRSRR